MNKRKVHKRRRYRILTILAVFQPGGAHRQGPLQAHENPGAGDEHLNNKCSKNYGVGGLECTNLGYEKMSIHVGGRQKNAGMAPGEHPRCVGKGCLASQLT
jgi:hypothetical protein